MMSNEFDLELANRGGVIKVTGGETAYGLHRLIESSGDGSNWIKTKRICDGEIFDVWRGKYIVKMAKPSECAEAGVEYIEPIVDVEPLKKRIYELEQSIKNLHKVKGRYHTQQSLESLFKLVGLENNIGEKNE